jgi:multimeric flavodoxin WrbA
MKIIGINGSPRKANTYTLLKILLQSAEKTYSAKTEIIELRRKKIKPCIGCFKCSDQTEEDYACPSLKGDDMEEIITQLIEADGIIFGSPVYFGGVTAQLKAFMDRTQPLLRYSKNKFKNCLRNKVGGALVVGGNRNGGLEATIQGIHHYCFIQDMVVVGTGPDEQPGCYLGAAGFSGTHPTKGSRVLDAVLSDPLAVYSAEVLGRRVGEMCNIIEAGR